MKKIILVAALLCVYAGLSQATNIPGAINPTDGGAEQWLVPVYNNSGATLDAGDVVIWDVDSSTGDDDNWVTTTTTADTALVAGVVVADISAAQTGNIVIHGPVSIDITNGHGEVLESLLCTSATAGSARNCTNDDAAFAIVTQVTGGDNVAIGYVFGR